MFVVSVVFAMAFTATPAGALPDRSVDRELPDSVSDMKLDTPAHARVAGAEMDLWLGRGGPERVLIRLKDPSVAEAGLRGRAAAAAKRALEADQDSLLDRVQALDPSARVLGSVQLVSNAVFVEVDTAVIGDILADPAVARVVPVADYQLDLSETVPYIGATAAQDAGSDGSGVRVAVLDSGIDYTHAALGGSGDPADYAANDPAVIETGTFPTAKVIGGFDFVGSTWVPGETEAPDPDPLDDGAQAGHGTHVGHIIGGVGGVAPAAELYAVKVCSSVSPSCSGVALIQAMEFAVDPDGDGDPTDAVDIVNMSLGSVYGQTFDDDLALAVDNASALGVLTVASAGNSADKPYVTGTPAAAPTALSVAQTQVPSAALQLISVDTADYPAVFQPWSTPLAASVSGPVQYGDGAGGNLDGCAAFAPGSLDGKIVLVDRGACNFTLKIKTIGDAGGVIGIIGLVAPGAPFSGGDGGDAPITIPGYMISQADSTAIKAQIGNPGIGTVDPANQLPLVGQVVGSSSRGPSNHFNQVKPEIGAPGASISAIAGSGTDTGPFGGTSGAAPMVAGSAALVLQAMPGLSPAEVKSLLMNTGDTAIDTDPFTGLAPITRIGGGEVRVDRALAASGAAWDDQLQAGALSFGYVEVAKDTVQIQRKVRVRNYSASDVEYSISPSFRFANDEASGAVAVSAPSKVTVKAGKDATFTVRLTIQGALLPGNFMNSGSSGASPGGLNLNEFDGYLTLDDGSEPIHVAWHVLPRASAELKARPNLVFRDGIDTVTLQNTGVGTAQNDAYALIGVSDDQAEGERGGQSPMPDIRAVGVNTFPVPADFCSEQASFVWVFAVNTWESQTHLLPVSHQIWLDVDQDGTDDYVVLNRDLTFTGTGDGRQVTWALDLATGDLSAFFFAEHATNTGNTVLLICGEQIGLTGTDMLTTNVDVDVRTQDFYFGGQGDAVEGMTITPLGERYLGIPNDVAGKSTGLMTVLDFGPFPGNSDELGVMLVTNGDRGPGARGGATAATEAMLFLVK